MVGAKLHLSLAWLVCWGIVKGGLSLFIVVGLVFKRMFGEGESVDGG